MKKVDTAEIDIIRLIKLFSKYKSKMILIITLSLLCGYGLNFWKSFNLQYEVTIPYSIVFYPSRVQELCNNDFSCMKKQTSIELKRFIDRKWNIDHENEIFTLTTNLPLSEEEYNNELSKVNLKITEEIYNMTVNDINLISSSFENNSFNLSNDTFLKNIFMLNQRLIYSIESGQKALFIDAVKIKKQSAPLFKVLFLSSILGLIVAIFYAVILNSINKK